MNEIKTVTIGIPAYNEGGDIGRLLKELLSQVGKNIKIKKIIVYSDGSTDKTPEIVSSFKPANQVQLIEAPARRGQAYGQNQIIKKANTDILILLNADIHVKDSSFIEKLCSPIIKGEAELTSAAIASLKPRRLLERILRFSVKYKQDVFTKIQSGDNIYTCVGIARAFEKKLYKSIEFKDSVGEDAFSYLFATFYNFKYKYVPSAIAYYKIPNFLIDHKKQSIRYLQSRTRFIEIFGKDFIRKEYSLPAFLLILVTIKYLFKNPLYMIFYISIYIFMVILSRFSPKIKSTWEIAESSKKLNTQ